MRWDNKRRNLGGHRVAFPREVKNRLFRAQKGRCAYCGHTHRDGYLEIDHKYPISRGGGNENDNLQLLCKSCNMRKGIQSDEEFRYRYQRLLPADDSIPSAPIPQDSFTEETQRTRAPREVTASNHERLSAARERKGAVPERTRVSREVTASNHERLSAARDRKGASCARLGCNFSLLVAATLVLLLLAMAFLNLKN